MTPFRFVAFQFQLLYMRLLKEILWLHDRDNHRFIIDLSVVAVVFDYDLLTIRYSYVNLRCYYKNQPITINPKAAFYHWKNKKISQ